MKLLLVGLATVAMARLAILVGREATLPRGTATYGNSRTNRVVDLGPFSLTGAEICFTLIGALLGATLGLWAIG